MVTTLAVLFGLGVLFVALKMAQAVFRLIFCGLLVAVCAGWLIHVTVLALLAHGIYALAAGVAAQMIGGPR